MSTKGDEQGNKITANTVALKTRVPGVGTQKSRQIFFCRRKEWTDNSLIELLTGLASFEIPLFV